MKGRNFLLVTFLIFNAFISSCNERERGVVVVALAGGSCGQVHEPAERLLRRGVHRRGPHAHLPARRRVRRAGGAEALLP